MEDILIIIFQFFLELALEVLAELPWDFFVGWRQRELDATAGPELWIIFSLIAGAVVGGLSLLAFPMTLLHWGAARMANLIVAPAISGGVSLVFSRSPAGRGGNRPDRKTRAVCAACFTLALAVIRFTYASRPS